MLSIKNTQPGPRGFNSVAGPILLEPGQSVDAKVYAREREPIEATGWFELEGDYEPSPGESAHALEGSQGASSDAAQAAADLLARVDDLHFKTFEAEAKKLLGDGTPSTKDEIIAALTALG